MLHQSNLGPESNVIEYRGRKIQQTKRGEFLVYFVGQPPHYPSLEAAKQSVDRDVEQYDSEQKLAALESDAQDKFNKSAPTLNAIQIAWQEFRNDCYDALQNHIKLNAAAERAGSFGGVNSAAKLRGHAQSLHETQDRGQIYDEILCKIDRNIKNARSEQNVEKLAAACDLAVAAITKYHWCACN
jgi:hypothetical protein